MKYYGIEVVRAYATEAIACLEIIDGDGDYNEIEVVVKANEMRFSEDLRKFIAYLPMKKISRIVSQYADLTGISREKVKYYDDDFNEKYLQFSEKLKWYWVV